MHQQLTPEQINEKLRFMLEWAERLLNQQEDLETFENEEDILRHV